METIDKTQLVTARTLRRMPQKTLARLAKISPSYLAELEKTGDAPSDAVQTRIAKVLKFATSELFNQKPKK